MAKIKRKKLFLKSFFIFLSNNFADPLQYLRGPPRGRGPPVSMLNVTISSHNKVGAAQSFYVCGGESQPQPEA